jgi:RecA-family ATPase
MVDVVRSWVVDLEAETPRLNLVRASQVRNRELPPMLIEGALPPGALFQIFGQTGEYKSFLVVDMVASVTNGVPWLGHEVDEAGHVALILGEGRLRRRASARRVDVGPPGLP